MSDDLDLLEAQRRIFRAYLRPLEKLAALALLDHWSRDSARPYPSLTRLERWTGLRRHGLLRALKGLEAKGAIAVIRGKRGTRSSYELRGIMTLPVFGGDQFPSGTGTPEAPVLTGDQSANRTSLAGEPVRVGDQTGASGAPPPVRLGHPKEPKKEPSKEPRESPRTRGWRRVPEEWEPLPKHRALAAELRVDLDREVAKYRSHEFVRAHRDANSTFETWLRRAVEFGGSRGRTFRPVQENHGADGWAAQRKRGLM